MKKKILIIAIVLAFFAMIISSLNNNPVAAYPNSNYSMSVYSNSEPNSYNYQDYIKGFNKVYPDLKIDIDATVNYSYEGFEAEDEEPALSIHEGVTGLYIPEIGDISWDVEVPVAGLYNIEITYYPVLGRSAEIIRGVQINGDYPFKEASNFTLPRIWEDSYDVESRREEGKHDQKPVQIEKPRWNQENIRDTEGYYEGLPYKFNFDLGLNTITFVGVREPIVISKITLFQVEEELSYQEIKQDYLTKGYEVIQPSELDENYLKIQAENAFEKSTPILAPAANWSSYKVEPYEKFMTRYNTIGGVTWRVAGDWVSWEVDIPKSGLYQLTFKALQNYNRGKFSTRTLYINGKVPFYEARSIQFPYDNNWQNITLGNEEGAYLFYFEAGKNIISLEATIGVYRDAIRITEEIIADLNNLYRKVVMITGVTPDKYQDYMLNERIDNLDELINDNITRLEFVISEIERISGSRGDLVSRFTRTLYQLDKFKESEQNIQTGIKELDDNIAALGTWVMSISEQSLAIDLFYVHGSEAKLPKAGTNIFQKIWHEFIMLIGSYGANTSLDSSVDVDGPTITVWIASGRDQSQLLRQLIDESFTVDKGINVELKLVSQTALLPATLSGNGPDVTLGVLQNIPVNWGIRNALVDLTQFEDFEEVRSWFHESAVTPFEFRDSVYALPDTHDFLVSFVRSDITEELGVDTPETWDEVVDTLPILQRQYLDYYIPNTRGQISTVMYSMVVQNGGSLYDEDGTKTNLSEKEGMEAFIDFTTFFSDYGFEVSAVFSNRFRTGEMPMGIYNFSLYNTLSVFAPEIRGHWNFAEIPGYVDEDGNICNQSASTSTGTVILANSQEIDASWEFIKWWLGEEAQIGYARGMEAILGDAARYPTANLKAFAQLPWSAKDYRVLVAQREKAVGIPTFPGDYIVGRHIDNAFRSVINNNINPRDSLYDYVEKINIELTRKREEFGLDGE